MKHTLDKIRLVKTTDAATQQNVLVYIEVFCVCDPARPLVYNRYVTQQQWSADEDAVLLDMGACRHQQHVDAEAQEAARQNAKTTEISRELDTTAIAKKKAAAAAALALSE